MPDFFFSFAKATNQNKTERRVENVRECNRITRIQAQSRPNYLQKEVRIQSSCFDTVYAAAGWTLIRARPAFPLVALTAFIQLRLSPGAPGSSHLLLCYGGQRGSNACHRCHLQLEQTELTATQLGTNAAEKEGRLEH